ncbi:hypothetical protein EON79_12040 [bacterium]|nr:MAG: hypothetical protein EON79_12040 [bacterium]
MLDKKDHSKIRFKRVNEETGKEVAWENIVKAYDFEGKYVILSDEDFKKAIADVEEFWCNTVSIHRN